jgi:soluble lytic murein transglycosylase-like protein
VILLILGLLAVFAWCLASRQSSRTNQIAWLVMAGVLLIVCILSVGAAGANSASPAPASKPDVRIPELSQRYRRAVEHASAEQFGLNASPARLAAQLHAESGWRHDAESPYAQGLAQFVPATARWLPEVCPAIGVFDPWDPMQSIEAAACYDRWLFDRTSGATECDRWAFTLSAYNGGEAWVRRDKRRASAAGADPARWFGHVDAHSGRAAWAIKENRTYVVRILLHYEPAYIRAGWLGSAACP